MKTVKKVLAVVGIFVILIVLLILVLRIYNDSKYSEDNMKRPGYMDHPQNVSLYPKSFDGIEVRHIQENTLQGFHLVPEEKKYNGVIVCYGGSEGSPNFMDAERLAKKGYETLAVFMYGMENQQKTLLKIPLEQFEDVLGYIDNNIEDNDIITVIGASKGAEYALNLATKYGEISNLILRSPSAYNFAGLDYEKSGSSWTWQGEQLPYIDVNKGDFSLFVKNMLIPILTKAPVSYRDLYDVAISMDEKSELKEIPVDKVKADILLIAGKDDRMWNSGKMSEKIQKKNEDKVDLHLYKGAGHIFAGKGFINTKNMRLKLGGSQEMNDKAYKESTREIDKFLELHHAK